MAEVKFYQDSGDGSAMAIETDATTEEQFLRLCASAMEHESIVHDMQFKLTALLPLIVDMVCKFRGYKSTVREERRLLAGAAWPDQSQTICSAFERTSRSKAAE